jgi:hypothetical protein
MWGHAILYKGTRRTTTLPVPFDLFFAETKFDPGHYAPGLAYGVGLNGASALAVARDAAHRDEC